MEIISCGINNIELTVKAQVHVRYVCCFDHFIVWQSLDLLYKKSVTVFGSFHFHLYRTTFLAI